MRDLISVSLIEKYVKSFFNDIFIKCRGLTQQVFARSVEFNAVTFSIDLLSRIEGGAGYLLYNLLYSSKWAYFPAAILVFVTGIKFLKNTTEAGVSPRNHT